MSLADHDNLFMPEKGPSRLRHIGTVAFFVPIIVLLLFPSFDLGRLVLQKPSFILPGYIAAGTPLVIQDSDDIKAVLMNGRPLAHMASPNLAYIGVPTASAAEAFQIQILFNDNRRTLKSIFKFKLQHPTAPYYAHNVNLLLPESASVEGAPRIGGKRAASLAKPARTIASLLPAAKASLEPDLFSRRDGAALLSCFQEPKLNKFNPEAKAMLSRPRKHRFIGDMYTVSTAGAGEVVFASEKNDQKTVIVYHGGGFYTRYTNLRDLKTHRGQKLKADQEIGTISFNPRQEPDYSAWQAYWGETPIIEPEFLALSRQLCGST